MLKSNLKPAYTVKVRNKLLYLLYTTSLPRDSSCAENAKSGLQSLVATSAVLARFANKTNTYRTFIYLRKTTSIYIAEKTVLPLTFKIHLLQ